MNQDLREFDPTRRSVLELREEIGLSALSIASRKLKAARQSAGRFRTRELVALLMAHGARSWRASLPATDVRLSVIGNTGEIAVRLRLR